MTSYINDFTLTHPLAGTAWSCWLLCATLLRLGLHQTDELYLNMNKTITIILTASHYKREIDLSHLNLFLIAQIILKFSCRLKLYMLTFFCKRTSQSKSKAKRLQFFTTLLLLLTFSTVFGQQTFRRHFIIAYDVSSPFVYAENHCPEVGS